MSDIIPPEPTVASVEAVLTETGMPAEMARTCARSDKSLAAHAVRIALRRGWVRGVEDTLIAVHFHDSTGQEDTPCLCDQPGTYARQAPNPLTGEGMPDD